MIDMESDKSVCSLFQSVSKASSQSSSESDTVVAFAKLISATFFPDAGSQSH